MNEVQPVIMIQVVDRVALSQFGDGLSVLRDPVENRLGQLFCTRFDDRRCRQARVVVFG